MKDKIFEERKSICPICGDKRVMDHALSDKVTCVGCGFQFVEESNSKKEVVRIHKLLTLRLESTEAKELQKIAKMYESLGYKREVEIYKCSDDTDKYPYFTYLHVDEFIGVNDADSDGWFDVDNNMPDPGELVWLSDGKGFTTLGCWVWTDEEAGDWSWADASNQLIYQDGGEIVADCEVDDLDVKYWHMVPNVKEVSNE
jgi:ribosomal protein S27AE